MLGEVSVFISIPQMRLLRLKVLKEDTRAPVSQDHMPLRIQVPNFFLTCLQTWARFPIRSHGPAAVRPCRSVSPSSQRLPALSYLLGAASLRMGKNHTACFASLSSPELCISWPFLITENLLLILHKPIKAKENWKWIMFSGSSVCLLLRGARTCAERLGRRRG